MRVYEGVEAAARAAARRDFTKKAGLLGRAATAVKSNPVLGVGGAMGVAGAGMTAMGAAQKNVPGVGTIGMSGKIAADKAANATPLGHALDLAAYGALVAGPVAHIVAPEWAHQNEKYLLGADIAGLGVLAREHVPGMLEGLKRPGG